MLSPPPYTQEPRIWKHASGIGDRVVDSVRHLHMFPKIIDPHIHKFQCIQRAPAFLRSRSRMAAFSMEAEICLAVCQHGTAHRKVPLWAVCSLHIFRPEHTDKKYQDQGRNVIRNRRIF